MINPDILGGRMGNKMFQLAYLYAQVKDEVIPDWFVQDPKYFDKYADEIRKLFGEGIGMLPYTAIHLRVGANPINPQEPKYSENPFYCRLIETGYYIDAVNLFPAGKFIVFSDDIEFAKTYFEGDRFAFDESKDDIEAFNKMASCQNIIIANSSYSWWAAWLSPHVDKVIVAPTVDKWYADGIERTKCPQSWKRI